MDIQSKIVAAGLGLTAIFAIQTAEAANPCQSVTIQCLQEQVQAWEAGYDKMAEKYADQVELNADMVDELELKDDTIQHLTKLYLSAKELKESRGERLVDIHGGLDNYKHNAYTVNYKTISNQTHKQDDYDVDGTYGGAPKWYEGGQEVRRVESVDTRAGEIEPTHEFNIQSAHVGRFETFINQLDTQLYGTGYVDGVNDGFISGFNAGLKSIQAIEGDHYNGN